MLKNTDVSDLNASEECIKESLAFLEDNVSKSNRRVVLDSYTALAFINLEWHEWNDAQNYF